LQARVFARFEAHPFVEGLGPLQLPFAVLLLEPRHLALFAGLVQVLFIAVGHQQYQANQHRDLIKEARDNMKSVFMLDR